MTPETGQTQGRCEAHVEKGGQPLAKSRSGVERRHRRCVRPATYDRTYMGREMALCGHHANRVDRGLPINAGSDW